MSWSASNINVSQRTKRIMNMVVLDPSDHSDNEVLSDDSYVPSLHDDDIHSDHALSSDIEISSNHPQEIDEELSDQDEIRSPDAMVQDDVNGHFFGKKNCFTWNCVQPNVQGKTRQIDIIKIKLSKLKGRALSLSNRPTPEEVWRLIFTEDIILEIVNCTNKKIATMRSKIVNSDSPNYKDTDKIEIEALLGLMIYCAIFKSGREDLASLFSTEPTGRPIFRAVMSGKRCEILLLALRFDDSSNRQERIHEDPAAAISCIFNKIISNCQELYSIGAHACVDETLIPFRGRSRFRVYMPNKPGKYGIKLLCLTDAHNSYLLNAYIYVGKGSDGATLTAEEKKFSVPTQSVIRLSKPIVGTNRNITADNWFSSIELVNQLKKQKLTYVGTLKKNKREIPREFLPDKNRIVGSSLYGFTKDITLLSYVPKKSSAVVLVSSMHHSEYSDARNNKPEIISFYNGTKSGVDTLDYMCSIYSTNRRTRRWPLAIFYHMLSVSCVNSTILYSHYSKVAKMKRFDFMKSLANDLTKPHMKRRLQIKNLPQEIKTIIFTTLGDHSFESTSGQNLNRSDKLDSRKTCRYCPYTKKRMTAYKCVLCETPNCLECSKKLCNQCVNKL